MSGIYMHSPQQGYDRHGRTVSVKMQSTVDVPVDPKSLSLVPPNTRIGSKSPVKSPNAGHTPECRTVSLLCPDGRCDKKQTDIFQHFFKNHEFIRIAVNVPLKYRLKNIFRDIFILYEPSYEIFLIGSIEESYQKYISFDMQIIYNRKEKCCGHPNFSFQISGITSEVVMAPYKNRQLIGKSHKKIDILKDRIKKHSDARVIYDLNIIVKRVISM